MLKLPEHWRSVDGDMMLIRRMSERNIRVALNYLSARGYISYATWLRSEPKLSKDPTPEDLLEYSERFDYWVNARVNAVIDAFEEELSYRRRNHLAVLEPSFLG